jgi:very-short-patch-repair endonuclease
VLENLLMLDGERLSYRSLDVEQIGSVYEAIMGFEVQVAQGLSIAVRPKDVVVNVEALLATKPKDRAKVLKDEAECKLTGKALTALSEAKTPEELLAALDRKVSSSRTPNLLPVGSLFLQPGEERRRTGSHYTPRKLTQPIVETTLRPVLEGLGERPTAEQILELKVCDLAMGSGAFLVEVCRQLAEKVVEAWEYHGNFTAYLPSCHPHPPTPSPIKGEGEPDRWEVPESLHQKMVEVARQFRKESTPSEEILWQALRGKKLQGKKFRRQQPIGSFIVDFFCPSAKLIVEVDGGIHESQRELDKARQELLESLGLQFIRFPSSLVENDLPKALEAIRAALNTLTPHPSPIKGEGNRTLAPFSPGGRRAGDEGEQPRPVAREVEPLLAARRLVAQRCLYGVDKNPFAVNLAKLSLWLVTLAKDRPFTFVDHALKCGDSLVGVSKLQVSRFMAASDLSGSALIEMLEDNAQKSKFYRDLIAFADEKADEDDEQKRGYLKQADSESRDSRILSDVVVASFFASNRSHTDDLNDEKLMSDVALAAFFSTLSKSKRDAKKIAKDLATKVNLWRLGTIDRSEVELIARIPRQFKRPVSSFHWEFEFPEVFNRENPGSDAIAGNPPFAGKNTLINAHPEGYLPWLQDIHPESHGNADLVAHFFRRAFNLLRQGGTLGLIATNTIAQGDTRSTGLRFICNNGGTIYNAQKRVKWPGLAAVVVSVVHIFKANPRNLGGP